MTGRSEGFLPVFPPSCESPLLMEPHDPVFHLHDVVFKPHDPVLDLHEAVMELHDAVLELQPSVMRRTTCNAGIPVTPPPPCVADEAW